MCSVLFLLCIEISVIVVIVAKQARMEIKWALVCDHCRHKYFLSFVRSYIPFGWVSGACSTWLPPESRTTTTTQAIDHIRHLNHFGIFHFERIVQLFGMHSISWHRFRRKQSYSISSYFETFPAHATLFLPICSMEMCIYHRIMKSVMQTKMPTRLFATEADFSVVSVVGCRLSGYMVWGEPPYPPKMWYNFYDKWQ